MSQAVQIAGAVAILAAFAAAQARIVDIRSWRYLWLNFLGALALAASASYEHQWGFLMLNSVWSAVSGVALVARARRREPGARAPGLAARLRADLPLSVFARRRIRRR